MSVRALYKDEVVNNHLSNIYMKDEIVANLNHPEQLEKLYRADKLGFKLAFNQLYPSLSNNTLAGFWNERLNFANPEVSSGNRKGLLFVIIAILVAGVIAKFPFFFGINEDVFYQRNIGFIVLPLLTVYFAWKNKISTGQFIFIASAMLVGVVFINLLPTASTSDTLILSCIHLVLFLWSLLGFAFVGGKQHNPAQRLAFLKYNGDLVVITTLIVIAGGILTAITIGLFSLIGFQIENFYFENIVVFSLPAAPIVGTYLTQINPQLVGKVSPVIAKIFSPLVLVMLVVYLGAIVYSGKNPYNDREFLFMFNGLLIGVMAIIFFSVAETTGTKKSKPEMIVLCLLSVMTILVNGIALSAILFRISTLGITPNRVAVMGGNIFILINLVLVTRQLLKVLSGKAAVTEVGKAIATYLPVYFIWTIVVTFLFPFLFGFR